jgi:hypothetical protein
MRGIYFTIFAAVLILYCGEVMPNQDFGPPARDEIQIGPNGIGMPMGRILLIKKEDSYWAVKFSSHEKRKDGSYSRYELYEISKARFKKLQDGEIYLKESKSWHIILNLFHRDYTRYADKLKFGSIELFAHASDVSEHAWVYFGINPGSAYTDLRLAPTPWTEISAVALDEKRIKWYQYDTNRIRENVPIDKLWD